VIGIRPSIVAGVGLATLAALGWAGQYVCIRVGTEHGRVTDAMLVSLACNVALLVPAALAVHGSAHGLTPVAAAGFAAAGLAGSFLSRLLQFHSTRRIGASRTAPTVSSSALVATGLAVLLLGETVTPAHVAGILLIVAGVAVVSTETAPDGDGDPPGDRPPLREAGAALSLPLLAALFLGVEPIVLRAAMAEGTPLLVGLAVMSLSAALAFVAYRTARGGLPRPAALATPDLRWHVGAGLAGTVALGAYFAALAAAPVVVVIPILQTAPLLVVGLSALALPGRLERVTPRLAAAAAVVVAGATAVSLAG